MLDKSILTEDRLPQKVKVCTPSNSVDLESAARGFFCGTAGDVSIQSIDNEAIILKNCIAGAVYYIPHIRVNSTGTTASDIITLF